MTDKVDVHVLKVPKLDIESKLKPIALPTQKGNGLIRFPNFYDDNAETVEEFLDELESAQSRGRFVPVLKKWLPAKEYEKFAKSYPSYPEQAYAVGLVLDALGEMMGTLGEELASENS